MYLLIDVTVGWFIVMGLFWCCLLIGVVGCLTGGVACVVGLVVVVMLLF